MAEARYKGQKVVVVSRDYADHVKFADDWLPATAASPFRVASALLQYPTVVGILT
jgi:nitrate reductase alpha subunit